ncbi:type I restriction-modification system subunit M [Helcococcus kunzii]|uniref:type I restriction-modification system subunit M n=1 Tax=Helcococcus kunzii TaxID=40091 RepID=UPI0024ADE91C|nr:type I restriction-modification system subunit M [Helcococcus kunzii]
MSEKSLYQSLWNAADVLRSKMDANEYKNYLLGIIFYKYLSDKLLYRVSVLLEQETHDLAEAQKIYEEALNDEEIKQDLLDELKDQYSYVIKPEYTFTQLMQTVEDKVFQLEDLQEGFNDIEKADALFENLFEDIDLYSKKLGSTPNKQNQTISQIMKELKDLNFSEYSGDVLGDAYEYLIGQFASESGKKAGEFYTPHQVSDLMARIVIQGKEDKKGFTVYDPTMGSGSLLLNIGKHSKETGTVRYFGQEINTSTYNLARMNMILHGVAPANQSLNNGDTLEYDWPVEEPTDFDAVVMNPPYSAKWSAAEGFLDDPRFSSFGVIPTASRADYTFLLHGFYHLKSEGVMAIVLPHGVLFRGAREEQIRKILLENGNIDTVIGLPEKIFFNTGIPTTVIILKKNRTNRDVLFIDASREFEKQSNRNELTEENITKILNAYKNRENIDKYAYLASFEEIKENEFNLNIPRYVDTFEPEPVVPLNEISKNLTETKMKLEASEKALLEMLHELHGTNEEADKELKEFIQALERFGE